METLHKIVVKSMTENDDGTIRVEYDIDDEFIAWFKKDQGLKRWSTKRFEKFIVEGLEAGLQLMTEQHKEGDHEEG